jgi:hypothetical protein
MTRSARLVVALALGAPPALFRLAWPRSPALGAPCRSWYSSPTATTGRTPSCRSRTATSAIPKDRAKKLTDDVGCHPAMGTLAELYSDQSAVCVVQGVGDPNPIDVFAK